MPSVGTCSTVVAAIKLHVALLEARCAESERRFLTWERGGRDENEFTSATTLQGGRGALATILMKRDEPLE